jgi:CelD/BcsL family acetyltransferase involved in cellulose biosynthesis
VTLLGTRRQLDACAARWNALCAEAAASPFLSHPWLTTWWECFGEGELRVLVATEPGSVAGDESAPLVGLAPLARERVRMHGFELERLGTPWNVHTPRSEWLFGEDAVSGARTFFERLDEDQSWDMLELPQVPEGSPTLTLVSRLAAEHGLLVGRRPGSRAPFLPLGEGMGAVEGGLSAKFRWRLRNVRRRAEREGGARLELVTRPDEVETALDDGIALEAAAWKGEAGTSIASEPSVEAFYRLLAYRAALAGMLELHFLRVGDRRVAFAYCLRHERRLMCLKGGYDPAFAALSPCNLLIHVTLESACARGLVEYDFLGDEEPWKRAWTPHLRRHEWLYAFRPSPRTRLLHLLKFRLAPLGRAATEEHAC